MPLPTLPKLPPLPKGISAKPPEKSFIGKTLGVVEKAAEIGGRAIEVAFWNIPKAFWTTVRAVFEPRDIEDKFRYTTGFPFTEMKVEGEIEEFSKKINETLENYIQEPISEFSIEAINALNERQRKVAAPLFDEKPGLSDWKEYAFTIASGGISLLEAIGIFYVTKSTTAAAGALSYLEATDVYNQARDAGKSPNEAVKWAALSGAGTFVLEKIGLDFLFKSGISNVFARMLSTGVFETGQEITQTVWQNLVTKVGYDKAQPIFADVWETAVAMFIPSLIAGGVIAPQLDTVIETMPDIQEGIEFIKRDASKQLLKASGFENIKTDIEALDLTSAKTVDQAGKIIKSQLGPKYRGKIGPDGLTFEETIDRFVDTFQKWTAPESVGQKIYKWRGGEPADITEHLQGQYGGTLGKGDYYAFDAESSKMFGVYRNDYVLPKTLKIFDMTDGLKTTPDAISQMANHPFYRKALKANYVDIMEYAATQGYDGIKFFDDNGVHKWLVLKEGTVVPKVKPIKVAPETKKLQKQSGLTPNEFAEVLREMGVVIQRSWSELYKQANQIKLGQTIEKVEEIPEGLESLAKEVRKYATVEELLAKIESLQNQIAALPKLETAELTIKQLPKEDQFLAGLLKNVGPQAKVVDAFIKAYGSEDSFEKRIADFYELATKELPETAIEKPTEGIEPRPEETLLRERMEAMERPPRRPPTPERLLGLPKPKKITRPEPVALREKLRAEARAAKQAAKEARKTIRAEVVTKQAIKGIAKKLAGINIKNIPLEYKGQVQEILSDFDLKFRTGKTLAKREALKKYVDRLKAAGAEVEVPEELIKLAEATPLNKMTRSQLEMLYDEVMSLVHLGRMKNRLIKIQAKRKINEAVNELSDHLLEGKTIKQPKAITKQELKETWAQRILEKYRGFVDRTYRIERILLQLDNYIENGLMQKFFWQPVEKATNSKIKGTYEVLDAFRDLVKKENIQLKKILSDTEEVAPGIVLTPSEKIGIYLHRMNEDNLNHIMYGNKLMPELIDKIATTLTTEEQAIADFLYLYFQREGPPISKIRTLVEGKSLGIVDNYFPIRLQWKADPVINFEQELNREENRRFTAKWASARMKKGFLRERTRKAMQPIDLDALPIFLQHLEAVEHYKAFAPVIRDMQMVFNNPTFRKAFTQRAGKPKYEVLNQWLKQVAETNPFRPLSQAEGQVRGLRVNAVTAILGFNITTSLKQFPSFFNGMAEIGELPAIKGTLSFLRHPKEVRQQIKDLAPQIYKRSFEREVAEVKLMKKLNKRLTQKLSAREVFMLLSTTADKVTVSSIWKGAFDEYIRKNPGDIKEAADYATKAVRKTQPFFSIKDLPEYYRSGELMKGLTTFTNQLNQNWNYYRFDIWGKLTKGKISFADATLKTIESFVVPALLIGLITRSRPVKNVKEFLKDIISQALAIVPVLGNWLASGYKGFTHGGIVATEMFQEIQNVAYQFNKKEWDNILRGAFEVVGYTLGLPITQTKRVLETIVDMNKGETDDWLRLIWGKYTREKAKSKKAKPLELPKLPSLPKIKLPKISF